MRELHSVIGEMEKRQAEREQAKEIQIENEKEYRVAVNKIFSSNEGKMLAKYMLRFNGVFQAYTQLNPAKIVEEAVLRSYYLKMIRPYLDKKIRMEIENAE